MGCWGPGPGDGTACRGVSRGERRAVPPLVGDVDRRELAPKWGPLTSATSWGGGGSSAIGTKLAGLELMDGFGRCTTSTGGTISVHDADRIRGGSCVAATATGPQLEGVRLTVCAWACQEPSPRPGADHVFGVSTRAGWRAAAFVVAMAAAHAPAPCRMGGGIDCGSGRCQEDAEVGV